MDKWNICSWNNFDDDDDDDDDDDGKKNFDWSLDDIVTVNPADNEICPDCASSHVIQNVLDRWKFLCLACGKVFRNS